MTPALKPAEPPTNGATAPSWQATPSGIGVVAHAVIAELSPALTAMDDDQVTEQCLLTALRLAKGAGRTARANAVVAAGWANHYLRSLSPQHAGWHLLASEFDVGSGRVDLSHGHDDGSVLFDEIKTGYAARNVVEQRWLDQAARYAQAGDLRWRSRFIGVRIVPIGSTHLITLVRTSQAPLRLRPTPSDPLRRQT